MNKKEVFFSVACALMAAPLLWSCQDDLDNTVSESAQHYTYNIVADANVAEEHSGATRSLGIDAQNKVKSTWEQGDKIIAYVLNDELSQGSYSSISSLSSGAGARFKGAINSKSAITTSSQIAFLYPGEAAVSAPKTIIPVTATEDGNEVYHDESDKIQKLVELNLTAQDGTLETIGKRFDYQWMKKSPKSVTQTDVNVNIGDLKRLVSIWALRFTDENNAPLKNIDSIYISNIKTIDVLDLSTGEFVANNPKDESTNLVLTAGAGKTFSSEGGKYTYAALLPGKYSNVLIMAYVGNKCYKKVYSTKPLTFTADNVYRTDVLKMEEAKQATSVNVQGVDWATGNFIHYEENGQEYWGIAPTQWWISKRAIYIDSDRKETQAGSMLVSSQFADLPVQEVNDVDLWRFGAISRALELTANDYKRTTKDQDLGKTFWNNDLPYLTRKVNREQAHYGDLVWYHTMNNHKKYRMPTKAELETLAEKANVIPAFCYTDKGTIVYGAYFTTNKPGSGDRKKAFPTGVKAYYKYSNVTALVKANMGLFLPIAGNRALANKHMGYRDMTWGSGAFGEYQSSTSFGQQLVYMFRFGPKDFDLQGRTKGQAASIRPVLDHDDEQADPAFAPFKNIK